MAGGSDSFVMTRIGEPGPEITPDEDYFSVKLLAIHVPASGFLGLSKNAPVVWSAITYYAFDGENGRKQLLGLFPLQNDERPKAERNYRVTGHNLQLTPRIVAQPQLTLNFTLASMREKDFLAGILKAASDIATSPAATFVSQIIPGATAVAATVGGAATAADSVRNSLDELLDGSALKTLGWGQTTLQLPAEKSGVFAYLPANKTKGSLKYEGVERGLTLNGEPVKSPYVVVELVSEKRRPDWMTLPDIAQAWTRLREARIKREGVDEAYEVFRLTALTSPDLTAEDARKLSEGVRMKFALESTGAESGSADPGDLAEALSFFMGDSVEAMETATLAAGPPWKEEGPFLRAYTASLGHEGGYVDHPKDRGGPTNKGVTQKTYDAFRATKKLASQPVKEITEDEIGEIYYQGYWRPAKCALVPNEAMASLVFDAAINHGPNRAIRLLQQAARLAARECDGKWGRKTAAAVAKAAEDAIGFADDYLLARERFYRWIVEDDPEQGVFLRGWMNRLAGQRALAMALLSGAPKGLDTESGLINSDAVDVFTHAADADFSMPADERLTAEATS